MNQLNLNQPSNSMRSYDDILHFPHHVSATHPQMPVSERAAQFSPFAALTGHQKAIKEAARLTNEKIELDENSKTILDQKLQNLLEYSVDPPEATVTYFQKDSKKDGGSYRKATGIVTSIHSHKRTMIMEHNLEIPLDDIVDIQFSSHS